MLRHLIKTNISGSELKGKWDASCSVEEAKTRITLGPHLLESWKLLPYSICTMYLTDTHTSYDFMKNVVFLNKDKFKLKTDRQPKTRPNFARFDGL